MFCADRSIVALEETLATRFDSLSGMRDSFAEPAHAYFSLAALSRRSDLADSVRETVLSKLHGFRALLEDRMLAVIEYNADTLDAMSTTCGTAFFGKSRKQGVSIRYALSSCVPTPMCGGRCYAHDGRDRELIHIFRGVRNYHVGREFEKADEQGRRHIMRLLDKAIDDGIEAALDDRDFAAGEGFDRLPRIRFSHVGEMAETPEFTNALAREIKTRNPSVQCVVYTRHPKARLLDTDALVVNFTVEQPNDRRLKFAPEGARIVNSSWDGSVNPDADVNFLEHHVERAFARDGRGSVCPVTANHKKTPSCDTARCQKCFVDYVDFGNLHARKEGK